VKTVLKFAILIVILNAAYQFARPFHRFTGFKKDVQALALAAKGRQDYAITTDVMQLAARHRVPVPQDAVRIERSSDLAHTYIDASWTETIEFFPKVKYPWKFEVHADGWHVKPVSAEDLR
jgi:hypothetical protein